jgi:hypothetical protein
MKKSVKWIVGGIIAAAILVPAAAASATSTYVGYNVNLPSLQQGVLAASQTKTAVASAGNINVSTVGSTYTLNARQCRVNVASPLNVSCGTERDGLGGGSSATLPSGSLVAAGHTAFLQLFNSTWTVVNVQATGSWRAN